MSTFILPDSSPETPVKLTSDLSRDQLLTFPAFKNWISTLQHSLSLQKQDNHAFYACPYKLREIDIQHVDFFGGGRLGFIKLKAEVSNDDGEKLPGSVFLRGGSVGMMVCFILIISPSLIGSIIFSTSAESSQLIFHSVSYIFICYSLSFSLEARFLLF